MFLLLCGVSASCGDVVVENKGRQTDRLKGEVCSCVREDLSVLRFNSQYTSVTSPIDGYSLFGLLIMRAVTSAARSSAK